MVTIAFDVEHIRLGRQKSFATQFHLILGVILNQRLSTGSVAQTGAVNMGMAVGGFLKDKAHSPFQGS